MYDRRIDGEAVVFGNQGALYKNAMTWFDHPTGSVWSQVTGEALFGELAGTRLTQLPAAIETWGAWRSAHPDTEVLRLGEFYPGATARPDFVIGIAVGEDAIAYDYPAAVERVVQNGEVGGGPIAVWARDERLIRVFSRDLGERVVELRADGDALWDPVSGTRWNARTGIGIDGPLAGETLAPVAWISSFDWAWLDFHPDSPIVR